MSKTHLLSRALTLFAGDIYYARYHKNDSDEAVAKSGLRCDIPLYHDFGAPATALATGLVSAATGAELPNNATTTYTTANDNVSPIDDASRATVSSVVMADGTTQSVWVFDKSRNVSLNVTHGSSIVAMTCLVSGYDFYGEAMSELLTITATGTNKTAAGKKAFKYIKTIAFASAGNATANTANLGWADVMGMPYRFDSKNKVIPAGNGALDASATIVVADDTSPATTTTGDVRGTIDFNTANDGAKTFGAWILPASRDDRTLAFGVTQA